MILLECFTEAHIDNIAACLRLKPREMVLLGDGDAMEYPLERYEDLLNLRNQDTKITPYDIRGKDFPTLCTTIYQLLEKDEKYVIDLSGGDELVIMAVGAVLSQLESGKRQNIQVENTIMTKMLCGIASTTTKSFAKTRYS